MTRQTPAAISVLFILFLFGVACGPDPVGPRPLPEPSTETPPADPGVPPPPSPVMPATDGAVVSVPDAGAPDTSDSGAKREKLPAPDAGVGASVADAGDDARLVDARVVDAGDAARVVDAGDEAVAARPPVAGEIVIAEALANPAGADTGREWIEIVSRSSEPLDLSDLHVADAAVDVAAPAGIVDAGGRLVLGQSADASKNGGAPVSVAYGTRLGLNNDGEEISICVGPCAGGVVIDQVGWKALGAAYDGHALVFDRDANLVCPATQPFGAAGDFGTPGGPNDACPAPDAGF